MCYPAKCSSCGKTTWAGCGKHVPSVYAKIAKDQVCMCKGWPGVQLPKEDSSAAAKRESDAKAASEAEPGVVARA